MGHGAEESSVPGVDYAFSNVVFRDTQRDAAKRLAQEIVERVTGVKALEEGGD